MVTCKRNVEWVEESCLHDLCSKKKKINCLLFYTFILMKLLIYWNTSLGSYEQKPGEKQLKSFHNHKNIFSGDDQVFLFEDRQVPLSATFIRAHLYPSLFYNRLKYLLSLDSNFVCNRSSDETLSGQQTLLIRKMECTCQEISLSHCSPS